MIFITVGTHEQQFNRLIKYIDSLKEKRIISEEVFIQTGFCTYEPKYCKWSQFLSYDEMWNMMKKARIIITHGGPSTFIMPLQIGKIPVVVPRQFCYEEHVNNHQVEFVKFLDERQSNIISIYDINELCNILLNYDDIVLNMSVTMSSNNKDFNIKLEKIIKKMIETKK